MSSDNLYGAILAKVAYYRIYLNDPSISQKDMTTIQQGSTAKSACYDDRPHGIMDDCGVSTLHKTLSCGN